MWSDRKQFHKRQPYGAKYHVSASEALQIRRICLEHLSTDFHSASQAGYGYPTPSTYFDSPSRDPSRHVLHKNGTRYKRIRFESCAMPSDHGFWLHDERDGAPVLPDLGRDHPEDPTTPSRSRSPGPGLPLGVSGRVKPASSRTPFNCAMYLTGRGFMT